MNEAWGDPLSSPLYAPCLSSAHLTHYAYTRALFRQAQLTRLEQELQDLRRRGAGSSGGSPSQQLTATSAMAAVTAGGAGGARAASHAEAVEAELAELTRVNSQLRGELIGKETSWREERMAFEAAVSSAKVIFYLVVVVVVVISLVDTQKEDRWMDGWMDTS